MDRKRRILKDSATSVWPKGQQMETSFTKTEAFETSPEQKQALQKTSVILKKRNILLEKIWYFLWRCLCNSFVLSFGCPALAALSLTQSCELSSSDLAGPWMRERLEIPVTKITSQEETAEESVAECEEAGRLFSPTAPALFKQPANFYFPVYCHVGAFSMKLCAQSCGGSLHPCVFMPGSMHSERASAVPRGMSRILQL